jgi:hypothetical protein
MLCAASVASILRNEVTEQQAMAFFEKSYRLTYLRLMVVVSGLYQQYDGKETYFWQAQQLTDRDYGDSGALMDAFLYVVSGMEDVQDIAKPRSELDFAGTTNPQPIESTDRGRHLYNIYNKVFFRASMSPETANDGLYVTMQPRLGLALAGAAKDQVEIA